MTSTLDLIKSDLRRMSDRTDLRAFLRYFFRREEFNYMVWFRLASGYKKRGLIRSLLRRKLRTQQRRFGIVIPAGTSIGPGFYIGHFGGIVVNETAVIGANCNIAQGLSIGSNHGKAATIGDNVYIGPNVCIVEDVTIGDNVTIGAGSVVTRDIPSNVTAAGSPARVLRQDDEVRAGRYIKRRWAGNSADAREEDMMRSASE
jgi:serine O-acetyltransferase